MSKLKELYRKTPLPKVYWGFMTWKPIRKMRKKWHKVRDNVLLYKRYPKLYLKAADEPVDENKILFIELRLPQISNSFELLYEELTQKYGFDVHVHLLRRTFVGPHQFRLNCEKMIRDMATAKYVFLNEASAVHACLPLRPETTVIQTWHACGAFKRFGSSTAEFKFGPSAEGLARHPINRNYTYVTVSSPEVIWAYEEAMDLKDHPGVVRPTGVSRTDIFFREEYRKTAFNHLYELFPAAKGKKIISFAPTFRGRVASADTPRCFDIEMFHRCLGDDYVIITKHHPLVRDIPPVPEGMDGIWAYDATKTMTIEDLLFVSDICISDYSSLIYEFSLFERPMLFYAYDLEDYFDWRGFYYPYEDLTPGPVCRTNEEMIDYIQHLDERFDKQKVIDFKNRFMSACDGHATERILNLAIGEKELKQHRIRKQEEK